MPDQPYIDSLSVPRAITKDDLLKAIDYEIAAMGGNQRYEGLSLWTALVALAATFLFLANQWEAGRVHWTEVTALFLAFTFIGEAIAVCARISKIDEHPHRHQIPPVGMVIYPATVGVLQRILLLLLAVSLYDRVWPPALICLFLVLLHRVATLTIIPRLLPRMARSISTSLPIQAKGIETQSDRRDAFVAVTSLQRRFFVFAPVVWLLLGIEFLIPAHAISPGQRLTDVRIAAFLFAAECLLSFLVRDRVDPHWSRLVDLRRAVVTGLLTPRDGAAVYEMLMRGVAQFEWIMRQSLRAVLLPPATQSAHESDGSEHVDQAHGDFEPLATEEIRAMLADLYADGRAIAVVAPEFAYVLVPFVEMLRGELARRHRTETEGTEVSAHCSQ